MSRNPRIGLALGGGAARGWAHLGVLQYLDEIGIRADVLSGTSIGSIVAGAESVGHRQELADWARSLDRRSVIASMDLNLAGGLIKGARLMDMFRTAIGDREIDALDTPYGAVATDLATGREVWITEGDLIDAVRASIALPGLLTPWEHDGRWLADGALVNPVPVSLCRALGADRVIAVDLNAHILSERAPRFRVETGVASRPKRTEPGPLHELFRDHGWRTLFDAMSDRTDERKRTAHPVGKSRPSMVDSLVQSLSIMQTRITDARLAGDPPDVLLRPQLAHIQLMDFHRADDAIQEGYEAARRSGEALRSLVEHHVEPDADPDSTRS